jgi:hypothetical protein
MARKLTASSLPCYRATKRLSSLYGPARAPDNMNLDRSSPPEVPGDGRRGCRGSRGDSRLPVARAPAAAAAGLKGRLGRPEAASAAEERDWGHHHDDNRRRIGRRRAARSR